MNKFQIRMREFEFKVLFYLRCRIARCRSKRGITCFETMAPPKTSLTPTQTGDRMSAMILAAKPVMISRLGGLEACTTVRYLMPRMRGLIGVRLDYVLGIREFYRHDEWTRKRMFESAGFFEPTDRNLDRFGQRMLEDLPSIDLLGSWLSEEHLLGKYLQAAQKTSLFHLEPFFQERPWTEALSGKRVLVVHPFTKTIESQYAKRDRLFEDRRLLPDFQLITFQSVQSIALKPDGYKDWFHALSWMRDQISRLSFDVAIIGCGAYGLPLAADIKRMGRIAIHLGGATQLLFGIHGKRWDSREQYFTLFNEHWVRPSRAETPAGAPNLEDGAYW